MKSHAWSRIGAVGGALFLSACATAGVNPTGLTGGQITCPEGQRQALDCRGALQQYARDFKIDLSNISKIQVGLGVISAKLMEADALSSDLIQHYYQTCALYNACLITRQEYVAKVEQLREIQLEVRRALAAVGLYGQQHIQINPPPFGAPPPGGFPPPGGTGVPPAGSPRPTVSDASQQPGATGGATAGVPPPQRSQDTLDTVLNILREGSKLVRTQKAPGQTAAPPAPPKEDLDASLRTILISLKQDVTRRNPALASSRAVVGNFTEEGQPWSGPLGALLRDRVALLVETEGFFKLPGVQARGITVRQVAAVESPNDPKALSALYNADLAIAGTYRPEPDRVAVRLTAFDAGGRQLAQASKTISTQAIPDVVNALPANTAETSQLLNSLNQLGPKSQGGAKVEVTANRPGAGASFRLGEEIRYFVTSTVDGYLYLFHMDAGKNLIRIFPNQYQQEARVRAGTLEVPGPGAPFKFEASPPFGLETTFAIVTAIPLDERDFQIIESGFARPKQEVPAPVGARGISISPTGPVAASPSPAGATTPSVVWNSVTVLIRP